MKKTWNEFDGIGKLNEDNLQLIEIRGTEYRNKHFLPIEPAVLRDGETDICVLEMNERKSRGRGYSFFNTKTFFN